MSIILSIIAAVVAAYAGVISTLSLRLAARALRAGGPIVDMDCEYFTPKQELTLTVTNTGRADVTVSDLDLAIIRSRIVSRLGNAWRSEWTVIEHISPERWRADLEVSFPIRLISHSSFSVKVSSDGIRPLPSQYPFDELLLRFTARTPDAGPIAYFRGNLLRHFIASDPDLEVVPDGGGAVPLD